MVQVQDAAEMELDVEEASESGLQLSESKAKKKKERKPPEKEKKLTKTGSSGKGKAPVKKPKEPSEEDVVRSECEKAVKTMKNNPQRAQKAIKEACQKHPTVSLGFRYQAHIEKRLAEQQNDMSKLKKQHIKTALEAAKQATLLSPNSLEHALFYAVMLHDWVPEGGGEEVVAECERALSVKTPKDPGVDMLGEIPEELKDPETRMSHFTNQLRQLIHQVKLSGLQHMFKQVSMDSEGNLVPLVRQLQSHDKELEQRILQPKRANEVKKSTKTEAERRKQIEVQLEATRLLMHQKEADKRKGGPAQEPPAEPEQRGEKEKKQRGGKTKGPKGGAEEKLKKVEPFWVAASGDKREELLQVPLSELTRRLKSGRMAEASTVLEEALEFYKENQAWKYWVCHKCNDRFKTGIEHKAHFQEKHLIFPAGDEISPVDLPANFDIDKMLPTDGKEAARLLLEDALQKRVGGVEVKQATSPKSPGSEPPFLDAHESVLNPADADGSEGGMSAESGQFEEAGEQFEPLLKEGEENEHFVDTENGPTEMEHFCPTHGVNGCPITLGNQDIELPVVEDEKRTKALSELLNLVRVLIEHKLFFMNHQHKIFNFLVDVLQALLPDPAAAVEWQHDWNLLRLVDEESIGSVRAYLEDEILGEGSENKLTVTWNVEEDEPVVFDIGLSETQDTLLPSKRLLYLLLHKEGDPFPRPESGKEEESQVAECEAAKAQPEEDKTSEAAKAQPTEEKTSEAEGWKEPVSSEEVSAEEKKPLLEEKEKETESSKSSADGSEGTELVTKEAEQVNPPSSEDQLRWVFDLDDKPAEVGPNSWTSERDRKKRLAEDFYNELRKHHRDLSKAFQEKVELINDERSVGNAEHAILIEVKRAEVEGIAETEVPFANILRNRMDELQKERLGLKPDKAELRKAIDSDVEAIRLILSKANSLQIHLQRTRLNGRGLADSSEDEGDFEFIGLRDSNRFKNKKVRAAFESVRQEMENRLENIEKRVVDLQRVISLGYVNLQEALGFDYRHALVPLVKQHIQTKLITAVDEDAVRKSDEARATLLLDLEKESKTAKPEAPKPVKAKDAKKKDKRKSKDAKKALSAFSERDGEEGEESEEEQAEEQKEKEPQKRLQASYDEEDERRLQANLERQRLEEEALAKEKNRSLDAAARRKIEQAEREALLREDEEDRQLKQAIAESQRLQGPERKLKQQNGDTDTGWELAGPSRRGGHLHQGSNSHQGESSHQGGHSHHEQRRGEDSMRPMTTGGMREGQRSRVDPGRIPVVQHPQHHQQNGARPKVPHSPPQKPNLADLALQQLEDLSKSSSWSNVAGARAPQKSARSLKDQQQATLAQRRTAAYYPDTPEQGGPNGAQSAPPDADSANGGLTGVVEEENDVSNLMLLLAPPKSDNGFAAALRVGLPEEQPNGSVQESESERKDNGVPEDDKRFQADIQLAMQQSLQAAGGPPRPQFPPVRMHPSANGSATAGAEVALQENVAGKGLVNETGQYNCFLNVVIQSLWHLRSFRRRLLDQSSEAHAHVGRPCVVCALREIFTALDNRAPGPGQQGAVDPTPLRMALDAMYSETNFFQEGQMNDASEVLDAVFDAMHKAYTAPPGQEYADSDKEESEPDAWTCTQLRRCIVHDLFGLDVAEEMNCRHCGMVSRKLKYTSYFHNINASALRREKSLEPKQSLAELLHCINHHHDLPCDPDIKGCNKVNRMQYELRATPHVFTTVLGWQTSRESIGDISATINALEVDVDVLTVYQGVPSSVRHRLVSVVCYYGQHYHCFAYNQELARWVMFDDTTVKLIGSWDDVTRACCRGHLQPQVLFYERVD